MHVAVHQPRHKQFIPAVKRLVRLILFCQVRIHCQNPAVRYGDIHIFSQLTAAYQHIRALNQQITFLHSLISSSIKSPR